MECGSDWHLWFSSRSLNSWIQGKPNLHWKQACSLPAVPKWGRRRRGRHGAGGGSLVGSGQSLREDYFSSSHSTTVFPASFFSLIWKLLRGLEFQFIPDILMSSSWTELQLPFGNVNVDTWHDNEDMHYLMIIHWRRTQSFMLKEKRREESLGGAIVWRDQSIPGIWG